MNYEEIYKKILYELDEIDRINSAKFFAQTDIEINIIEHELSKHRWKAYNYLILFNAMIDDDESLLLNSKHNISGKCDKDDD